MNMKKETSMRNVMIASAVLAALAGATVARADDSGHAGPQSLKAQQSLHNGTLGTTTENHTDEDAATTPVVRNATGRPGAVEGIAPKNQ
jgi:hypothetical protein